jgi:hypothetical protein
MLKAIPQIENHEESGLGFGVKVQPLGALTLCPIGGMIRPCPPSPAAAILLPAKGPVASISATWSPARSGKSVGKPGDIPSAQ